MKANRAIAAWLRPLFGLVALAAIFALNACGGGSGAPNNPYAPAPPAPTLPSPLTIVPPDATVYPGTPATLTVSGGTLPYEARSSNPAVLPVTANVPGDHVVLVANPTDAEVGLAITVQDSGGQSVSATITVLPAPLFGAGLTVLASSPDCGSANLCSGATGTAAVTARGVAGAPLSGRQIKFEVVYGPFAIQSTNPATPLVQTLTVVTDGSGVARVGIQANVDSPTEPAQIRATDLATGQPVIGNFTVVNNTTSAITIVPDKATIKGTFEGECSSGFRVDYFIYGGNPPYRVSSTFPDAVSLSPTTVAVSGGYFSAVTNGTCVDPLTFTILDAAGKQTTAQLQNLPGTEERPVILLDAAGKQTTAQLQNLSGEEDRPVAPVPTLLIQPGTVAVTGCAATTVFQFVITGGTPGYGISTSTPGAKIDPPSVSNSGGTVQISGLTGSTTTVVVVDQSSPQKTATATINCN